MAWVRLDDGFPEHPKIAAAGPLAMALHVAALCYCNRNLTDGFVPNAVLARLADFTGIDVKHAEHDYEPVTVAMLAEQLVQNDLWHEAAGGHQIHDYLDYQTSRADIRSGRDDLSVKRSQAGKAGAQARWHGKNGKRDAIAIDGKWQSDGPNPTQPIPTPGTSLAGSTEKEAPSYPPAVTEVVRVLTAIGKPGYSSEKITPERIDTVIARFPGLNAALEAESLADYETSGGGASRKTKDGVAAYRNWLRKAAEFQQPATDAEVDYPLLPVLDEFGIA